MTAKKGCLDIPRIKATENLLIIILNVYFSSDVATKFSQDDSLEVHHIICSHGREENRKHKQAAFYSVLGTTPFSERERNGAFPTLWMGFLCHVAQHLC